MGSKNKPLNEWQILRNRYQSSKAYKKRKALNLKQLEEFSNWVIDKGADVLAKPAQYEVLRFWLNGELGVLYQTGSGNLLMHDLGEKFSNELKVKSHD